MKKIVSNVLIVSTQLIIGGLFLFMLFSGHSEDSRVVVVENNNLDKMADAVSELFEVDHVVNKDTDETKVEELVSAEEKAKQEEEARIAAEQEAARKAEEAQKLEAERKAQEEAERKAKEEAERKAQEEAARVAASGSQSVASLQDYAHSLVINTYGWSEADFTALVSLWNKESGWSVTAGNSRSGAYGIPQSLPGSKMASEGADWATNGETQIRWGLKYILNTYGSPSNAWGHFLSHNWY